MRITILVEGETERVFKPFLLKFLASRLPGRMPKLSFSVYDGRIPKGDALKKRVQVALSDPNASDYVIALTDVYTGTSDFKDAEHAKALMTSWVGEDDRFIPHAALHDFEAWLLPYWSDIQRLAGHNRASPGANPEVVNHNNPPARRLQEIYRIGSNRDSYIKTRDAACILRDKDLMVAIGRCSEFKSFINTILRVSGGTEIS